MNNNIIVKDNFLPKSFLKLLQNICLSTEVEWLFHQYATDTNYQKDKIDFEHDHYFAHPLYFSHPQQPQQHTPSKHFQKFQPLLYFLEDKLKFSIAHLYRMNLTYITQRFENKTTLFHNDLNHPHYVGIFYLFSSDGPTIIEDQKVDCVENRMVFFNGSMKHAAVTQTNLFHRINVVINVNGNFL